MQGRIQKAGSALYRQRWALAAAALGALTFVLLYGVRVLDPFNDAWLLTRGSDPAAQYLGWVFYRHSSWRLPYLGMNYSVLYPHRISVVFSDALPLFAVPFKLLSPLLPDRFQYLGWWGILCFALQGFWGQKCIARIGRAESSMLKSAASLLGAQTLVLFPVLTARMFNHTALAGNWLILAALYLWLRAPDSTLTTRKACVWWGAMGFLCVNIMMYYIPMVGIILVGFVVHRALLRRSFADVLLPVPVFCLTGLFWLALLGAFAGNLASPSVGKLYGADFLNLIVPGLASSWEYDLYIGAGLVLALALAAAAFVAAWVFKPHWLERVPATARYRAVSSGVILLLTFAVCSSNTVTLGGHTFGTVPLPALLLRFWSMFTNCGRIGWVAGYLLAVLACGLILRLWRPGIAAALLAVCLAVQTGARWQDLSALARTWHDTALYAPPAVLNDPGWETICAQEQLAHMQFASANMDSPAFYPLCALAAQQRWTINEFYVSHVDANLLDATVSGQMNELHPDTLYVFAGLDELRYPDYPLHYYRLDGILIGTVEPLDLPDVVLPSPPRYELIPATALAGDADSRITAQENGSLTIFAGGVSGPSLTLLPGLYEVTLRGTDLDHSYVYTGWVQRNSTYHPLDIVWLEGSAETLTFYLSLQEFAYGWQIAIHDLDDTPVTVTSFTVTRTG